MATLFAPLKTFFLVDFCLIPLLLWKKDKEEDCWRQKVTNFLDCDPADLKDMLQQEGWIGARGEVSIPIDLPEPKIEDVVNTLGRALELGIISPERVLESIASFCESGGGFNRARFKKLVNIVVECSPNHGLDLSFQSVRFGLARVSRKKALRALLN